MPIETATFLTDLVATNPPGSDGLNQADDHMRLIKSVLLATLPNLNAAMTCTPAELNERHTGTRKAGLADGTSVAPSLYFDSETTLGLYRASAGHLSVAAGKRLAGNGTLPAGSIHAFPLDPGTSLVARGGTATGTEQFVEPDGSTYLIATFPDLAALYGTTFGGNGTTTFGTPDWKTAGKFLRHRTGAVTVGTAQANQNKSHTHTYSGAGGTGTESAAHQHTFAVSVAGTAVVSGNFNTVRADAFSYSGTQSLNSGTVISSGSGVTDSENAGHTHAYTWGGTTTTGSADGTEARPEAFVVFYALKT